jgi:hypothetical protein
MTANPPTSQGWEKKQTNALDLSFKYGEFRIFSPKSGDINVDSHSMMYNP